MTNQNQEHGQLIQAQYQMLEIAQIVHADYERTKEYLGQDPAMFVFNVNRTWKGLPKVDKQTWEKISGNI